MLLLPSGKTREDVLGKRICVVTSDTPFVEGGHLVIAREIVRQLEKFGYEAALVRTPQNPFGKQVGAYLATANTVLSEGGDGKKIDGIVSLRFPSFALKHPRHACWLNHRMREYYDLWPKFREKLSWKGRIKERVRRFIIHKLDEHCLDHRVMKLYAQSATIATRLSTWGGHHAEVLHPPAVEAPYRTEGYDPYIFAVSRIIDHKRVDLLVRAAAKAGVRAVIAGEGPDLERVKSLARELGADARISFPGRIDEAAKLDHYARCRAVCYPSFNEDYGLVTLEAFSSGKALIACNDGGGLTELVEDNHNGFLTEPDVHSLSLALQSVIENRTEAERLGAEALKTAAAHSWEDAIRKLVEW
jgi:glycosyltransferase involved in cell wall biosynthesis